VISAVMCRRLRTNAPSRWCVVASCRRRWVRLVRLAAVPMRVAAHGGEDGARTLLPSPSKKRVPTTVVRAPTARSARPGRDVQPQSAVASATLSVADRLFERERKILKVRVHEGVRACVRACVRCDVNVCVPMHRRASLRTISTAR
jgi:hypothetical protein